VRLLKETERLEEDYHHEEEQLDEDEGEVEEGEEVNVAFFMC